MPRQPSIFISHKHADRKIATEFKKFVDSWSHKEIPVFQSSDPFAQAPRLGKTLTEELKQALWNTGVVLLVYTTEDQDWSYCMWECGVATKPEAPQTRIIVLQCAAEVPKVFIDQVRVDVRQPDGVLKLVKDFLTDPNFFPGSAAAVAPKFSPDGPEIREAAADLHSKLSKVIPTGEVAECPAHPFVRLELKTQEIDKATSSVATLGDFEKTVLIREMDPRAWHIFGIASTDSEMSLETLVQHWAGGKKGASKAWVEDLRTQIVRAALGEIPAPQWTQLEKADGPDRYMPLLTRWRYVPALDAKQFDVSLIPFEIDEVLSALGDSYHREYVKAMRKVKLIEPSLVKYFTPIAARCFNGWIEYINKVITVGAEMRGPERLEITRLLVGATKQHLLVERAVGNPPEMHSRDWLAFYSEIGEQKDVEKTWMLCVEESEVRSNVKKVESAWKFFKDKKFTTLYCSPQEVKRSIGKKLPDYDVIENYGNYVKLLKKLPAGTYTDGEEPNVLDTTFRVATSEDRVLLRSMLDCSTPITEDWLRRNSNQ